MIIPRCHPGRSEMERRDTGPPSRTEQPRSPGSDCRDSGRQGGNDRLDIERPTTRSATPRCLVFALAFGTLLIPDAAASAAPKIAIPEALKQSAMVCFAEALRLCPDALASKDHGASCIIGKRRLLSHPCQGIYDQALRLLHGQDVHIDLRPPKKS